MANNRKNVSRKTEEETKKISRQQGGGIVCPKCYGYTKVRRTIPLPDENIQKRVRICDDCGFSFDTCETIM